jgi:hypothetical protein
MTASTHSKYLCKEENVPTFNIKLTLFFTGSTHTTAGLR